MATLEQLTRALKNADAAGDTDAARKFAGAIKALRSHPSFDGGNIPGYDPSTGWVNKEDRGRRRVEAIPGLDQAGAFALSGPEGVPIVGPALNMGVKAAAAAAVTPFSDQSFAENYDQMGRAQQDVQQRNPISTAAGNVTGAVAGTLPAMAAAPAAFGIGPGSLAMRMAASGVTGSGIGFTDEAVRSGGDTDAMITAAGKGFAAGLAGPVVSKVVGAGYRAASEWLASRGIRSVTDLAPDAVKRIAQVAKADGLDPAAIRQRLADLGSEARLADLGANFRQEAARLVTEPGPARSIVQNAVRERDDAANMRLLSSLDGTIGKAPVPSRVDASIRTNQKALSPDYDAVLEGARPVDTKPIADALDAMILRGGAQAAAKDVRSMLTVPGSNALDTNPRALLATRQAIDDLMESATGNTRRILGEVRGQVDDTLSASVPGIKEVDARFAELARQRNALERGQGVLDSGKSAIRPEELADEAVEAALPQGMLVGPSGAALRLREGARAEIDRIVGTNANDRARLAKLIGGEGDWNRAKLSTLFGREKADSILKVLEAEKTFAETSRAVIGNSETAARVAAREANDAGRGVSFVDTFKIGGPQAAARAGALRVAEALFGRAGAARKAEIDANVAKGIMGNNDGVIEALFQLQKQRPVPRAIDPVAQALLLSSALGGAR